MSQVVGLSNKSYKPITNPVHTRLCKSQKGCTRIAVASDKVYQLLSHGRWFSPGTPASSTTKTGRHTIAEILLKVALNTKNQNQNQINYIDRYDLFFKLYNLLNSLLETVFKYFQKCCFGQIYLFHNSKQHIITKEDTQFLFNLVCFAVTKSLIG